MARPKVGRVPPKHGNIPAVSRDPNDCLAGGLLVTGQFGGGREEADAEEDEMPLMDAQVDVTDVSYVLGLREATATAMADGWLRLASGYASFANLCTPWRPQQGHGCRLRGLPYQIGSI